MVGRVLVTVAMLGSLLAATPAGAQQSAGPPARLAAGPPARLAAGPPATPGSELTVYVMTMGVGARVWERFGHNAIWIHDTLRGTDQAYNYGLFDFRQENFLLRFLQGRMWYWMQGFDAAQYVQSYLRDDRSVWIQELNLPPEARDELRRFLEWNERPENRFYRYDYYRDNCSTRVRDALDRVLGGAIRRQTDSLAAGTTYRFHTQRVTANDPLVYTGLLLALGQPVDRPISMWEEMFLPLSMREHLRRITIPGPDGAPVPLVRSERTLFESSTPEPPPAPPNWMPGYLLVGTLLGAAAAALGSRGRGDAASRYGFAGLVSLWALVAGGIGLVLAGLWGLTDHAAAYRNENVLQANLLVLPLLLLAPRLANGSPAAARGARIVALVAVALSLLGVILKALPMFYQVNGQILALMVPIHLGVGAGILMAGRKWGSGMKGKAPIASS